jgi:type I site-specific restriction-modification system R (restriction) subunit
MEGKAMTVAMSRRIVVALFEEIVKLRPDWDDPDESKGAIKVVMTGSAADDPSWQRHIPQQRQQRQDSHEVQVPGRSAQARHRARHVADGFGRPLAPHDVRG